MPNVPMEFVAYIHALRSAELETISHFIPEGARVLEVGGGTGYQAQLLTEGGVSIVSVDVKESIWRDSRVFDIIEYDGGLFPFLDDSFDIVLSSHVLVQIPNLAALYREMARVFRAGGSAIHVVPTPWWRILAYLSYSSHLVKQSIVWCAKGSGAVRNLSANSWTPSRILRCLLGRRRAGECGHGGRVLSPGMVALPLSSPWLDDSRGSFPEDILHRQRDRRSLSRYSGEAKTRTPSRFGQPSVPGCAHRRGRHLVAGLTSEPVDLLRFSPSPQRARRVQDWRSLED